MQGRQGEAAGMTIPDDKAEAAAQGMLVAWLAARLLIARRCTRPMATAPTAS